MAGLADFRAQHPEYNDMPDAALADALHQKFYSDMPRDQFNAKLGLAPPAPVKPPMGWGEYADNLVRQIANGATFGFADELAAGANSILPMTPEAKGGYSANVAAERGKDAAFESQYPVASTSAQLAGGLATGVPGAAKMMTAKALSMVPNVVKAAGVGAAAGSAAGFGQGEGGLGPRLQNAVIPGVAGAALGGTLPYVMAGAGKVLLPLVPSRLRPLTGVADKKIAQALERDKLTPAQAQTQLDTLGPDATLADVGGRGVGRLSRGTAGASPTAEEMAASVFHGRQAGQGERVAGEAARTISPNRDFYGTINDLTEAQAKRAGPLYDKAYAANQSIDSREIDRILMTPAGRKALGHAATKMQNDMTLMGKPDPDLTAQAAEAARLGLMEPHGSGVGVAKGLKLRTLDYVKRALDDQVSAAYRAGEKDDARILVGLRNNFRNALDKADVTGIAGPNSLKVDGGLYAQARAAWSGPQQSMDALGLGRGILGKDSEITAKEIAKLSPGDRDFFRAGVVRALKDLVDNSPDGADAVKRIWGKPILREKLQAAFPSAKAFMAFKQAMDREATFYRTRANVLQGSRTAPMGRDMEDVGIHPALPVMGDLATGNTGGAVARSLGMAQNWLTRPSGRVAEQLGPKLFTTDPEANRALLARLGQKPPPGATATSRRAAIAAVLAEELARIQGR